MVDIISQWTSLLTGVGDSLIFFAGAVAVIAIIVTAIRATLFCSDEKERFNTLITGVIIVLAMVAVVAAKALIGSLM